MILDFFSVMLKFIGVNPTLVFGGALMDLYLIGSHAGGLSNLLSEDKEDIIRIGLAYMQTNSLWNL